MGRVKRILLLAASLGVAAGAHGQDERAAEEAEGAVAESAGQELSAQQEYELQEVEASRKGSVSTSAQLIQYALQSGS